MLKTKQLIGRRERAYDVSPARDVFQGKRVLVTGAGGSIATALVAKIRDLEPARLILLNHSESAIYRAMQDAPDDTVSVLCDVRDAALLTRAFVEHRPDVVVHTAAVKHVPVAEEHPLEAILTNVVGTRNVVDACAVSGVPHLVYVSTDKAVNATSVMGATKRAAEIVCQSAATYRIIPRVTIVRFANIVGSSGSVVPAFERQIEAGGPVTVTDPRVTRYFMTVEEAVSLVLLAATVQRTPASVFVLDPGKRVRIMDLASRMIDASRRTVVTKIVGLRPGEKMHEELHHEWERPERTEHCGLSVATMRWTDATGVGTKVDRMESAALRGNLVPAMAALCSVVPEYRS